MRLVWNEETGVPLYVQLYQQIRSDIANGNIPSGTKLPSSRKLSVDLHISRNTVELAYARLYSEGFLVSKPRSGNYATLPTFSAAEKGKTVPLLPENETEPAEEFRYDFRNGKFLQNEFPFRQWQKMVNRCFKEYETGFLQYGCPFGEPGLRSEIQKFLWNYRQIQCKARQIVIGTGTQFCLQLLCGVLRMNERGVAMEDPGYDQTRTTFRQCGVPVFPVGLDSQGIDVSKLQSLSPAAVYITPSNQYPTGIIMSPARRRELVAWAQNTGAYILEDDYNSCCQYDEKLIPSLRSICEDRVIYLGSFSDTTFPAIRVSYMVLPDGLLDILCREYCYGVSFVPFLTQKTLELFMRDGHWECHIRKTLQLRREKRNVIVSALKTEFGERIQIHAARAGLHLLAEATWDTDEAELIRSAARAGVAVCPVSVYWARPEERKQKTVLLNYGGVKTEEIHRAVQILAKAWN